MCSAVAEPRQPEPVLAVTAHQDCGLSLTHAWTAELKAGELAVARPGKQRRIRRLSRADLEGLLRAVRGANFQALPARLGQVGACDDCPRCRLDIDSGSGNHRVERVAVARDQAVPTASAEDARFRAVWVAIKHLAKLAGEPDACW